MLAAPVLAAVLAAVSLLLAAPVSVGLARAGWPIRSPRPALWLWQAVCLASGLCMIGSGLVLAVQPLGDNILTGIRAWLRHLFSGHPFQGMSGHGIAAGTLATAATLLLFGVLVRSLLLAFRRRRAHRLVLDLLTGSQHSPPEQSADLLAGIRILDHSTAVAYTVPGWHSRVVLSVGLVDLLDRAELTAVLDHERAHVRSRHDLLVLPFQAWATALGWLPGVRATAESVAELTEMLADDLATQRSSPKVLATALATVALAGAPRSPVSGADPPSVTGTSVARRVRRLLNPDPLAMAATVLVYLVAAALLAIPVAALWLRWR